MIVVFVPCPIYPWYYPPCPNIKHPQKPWFNRGFTQVRGHGMGVFNSLILRDEIINIYNYSHNSYKYISSISIMVGVIPYIPQIPMSTILKIIEHPIMPNRSSILSSTPWYSLFNWQFFHIFPRYFVYSPAISHKIPWTSGHAKKKHQVPKKALPVATCTWMPWEPWRRPDEKNTGQSGGKSDRSAFHEQNCGIYMEFLDGFIWIYMDLDLDLHGLIWYDIQYGANPLMWFDLIWYVAVASQYVQWPKVGLRMDDQGPHIISPWLHIISSWYISAF